MEEGVERLALARVAEHLREPFLGHGGEVRDAGRLARLLFAARDALRPRARPPVPAGGAAVFRVKGC